MKLPVFHQQMRFHRRRLGLSQKQAAARINMTADRWSQLERGYRRPTQREVWDIAALLQMGRFFVPPAKHKRYLLDQGARLVPVARPFTAHAERSAYQRFRHCQRAYPQLTEHLQKLIDRRLDSERCWDFAQNICFESKLEALNFLAYLAEGAKPALVAPVSLGRTPISIIDPRTRLECGQRPHYCLVHKRCCLFFQVSFASEPPRRVDILCWSKGWHAIEINGAGHDPSGDHKRELELGLPIKFLSSSHVVENAQRLTACHAA